MDLIIQNLAVYLQHFILQKNPVTVSIMQVSNKKYLQHCIKQKNCEMYLFTDSSQ